eukprot:4272786-Pleurochrysis_carterae.AAC.1
MSYLRQELFGPNELEDSGAAHRRFPFTVRSKSALSTRRSGTPWLEQSFTDCVETVMLLGE